MSLTQPVASDHQLARLLQIGMVLEEVVEARAARHTAGLEGAADEAVTQVLEEAAIEAAEHRDQLEALVGELAAEPVPYEDIETLVAARYEVETNTDGVLYDQLANEETAYKFYDDLINAIEESDVSFSIDREALVEQLRAIREDEAQGVKQVTSLMERRS